MKSFAKINLALDILGKDKTGYHVLQTVFQQINLFDEIEISECKGEHKVKFIGEEAHLINPQDNTVLKALKLSGTEKKYKVTVKKNIPLGAGLGGGSSNAACVLNFLNAQEKAPKISMDVAFFIKGGTAVGKHYGEEIETLPEIDFENINKILVIPQLRKSTKTMYQRVNLDLCGKNSNQTLQMTDAIKAGDLETVLQNIHNDFEQFARAGFEEIKSKLIQNGAQQVLLCGSGTAVIAFSNNPFDLKLLSQELKHQRILDLNR